MFGMGAFEYYVMQWGWKGVYGPTLLVLQAGMGCQISRKKRYVKL